MSAILHSVSDSQVSERHNCLSVYYDTPKHNAEAPFIDMEDAVKLWKGNLIAGEYTMTCAQIARAYMNSPESQIEWWPRRRKLLAFICGKDGLDSALGDGPSVERNLRKIEEIISNTTLEC